jgi:DNA polymerase-1
MGPAALSDYAYNSYGIKLTLTEAAKLRDAFFRAYSQFRQWQKTQSRKVAGSPGMLAHTRLGRPVECTKSVEDGGPFHYTRSLNVPIQGSCAEALLEALAALPGNGLRVL